MVTTVVSNMITDFDKKMIINFLERNYPISRIKINQRFRRAIVIDSGPIFILGEKNNYELFKQTLMKILSDIFYIDVIYLKPIVDSFISNK